MTIKLNQMIRYFLLQFVNIADRVLKFELQPNEWEIYNEN